LGLKVKIRKKVEYQCNTCGKLRVLFIAPALQNEKVASHGYIEFCDIHVCKNGKLNAIKLFVDKNYDVRSQVAIEATEEDEKVAIKEIAGLNIPIPKKAEFTKFTIIPTADFGGYNVKKIKIKDKMREREYILEGKENGVILKTISPLNFIEIELTLTENVDYESVGGWLTGLANIFESLVYLDESLLTYLGTYLDHMIVHTPTEKELVELSLLLHSSIALPHSTKEHIEIFEKHAQELFPDLSIVAYRLYKFIMESCLENEGKTLLDIYHIIKEKKVQIQAFPYFLSTVNTLISFGFINLEKLEFYTVS